MRVRHDFHPFLGSANLYEALVSIDNLGSEVVQPGYTRTLGWANGVVGRGLAIDPALGTVQVTPDGQALRLLVLAGSGLAGYAMLRMRARRPLRGNPPNEHLNPEEQE